MLRRTKILATLGPATDNPSDLEATLAAGVDIVRINFSHGLHDEHKKRILAVRQAAQKIDRQVAVLGDLQGPKIRIARFKQDKITLNDGDNFILDAKLADDAGDQQQVGIDYKQLPDDVSPGDILLLNDGLIEFTVDKVVAKKIHCTVKTGGILSNNKGINRLGGGLSAAALTAKDKADIKFAAAMEIDYLAVSFPRNAADIDYARELLHEANSDAGIIAKMERSEAMENCREITTAADGIMVARGDLGIEIGDVELPRAQKHLINLAREMNKPVITATQMMESMITAPLPTRAEVFDVANAVLDGTDAVMLSAETAVGANPAKVVDAMSRICLGAERQRSTQVSGHRMECYFDRVDEAIAMATMYTANHLDIKAIITLTESGSTPLWMSRIRSGIPIYGLSRHPRCLKRMTLYRGVFPALFHLEKLPPEDVNQAAVKLLEDHKVVSKGDWVIITRGDLIGVHGRTNSMKIVEVGAVV